MFVQTACGPCSPQRYVWFARGTHRPQRYASPAAVRIALTGFVRTITAPLAVCTYLHRGRTDTCRMQCQNLFLMRLPPSKASQRRSPGAESCGPCNADLLSHEMGLGGFNGSGFLAFMRVEMCPQQTTSCASAPRRGAEDLSRMTSVVNSL